jgi:cytidylate kinase
MMALITISRGAYTKGKEIAEKTAQELGYDCISREALLKASEDFDIPEIKLIQAIDNAPSFLDRFTRGREKYIGYIRAALFNQLKKDNVVYHGFGSHFFVKDIPRVLKVRVISPIGDRINIVRERYEISRKEAVRFIEKIDEQRKKWGLRLYGFDPSDPSLYDLVLHIDKIGVKDAVVTICRMVGLEQFQTTPESKQVLQDLALAAEVKTFLIGVKPDAEVCIDNGFVSLKTEAEVSEDSDLVGKMGEIVKMVPGVKGIKVVTEKDLADRDVCLTEPSVEPQRETKDIRRTYFTDLG